MGVIFDLAQRKSMKDAWNALRPSSGMSLSDVPLDIWIIIGMAAASCVCICFIAWYLIWTR